MRIELNKANTVKIYAACQTLNKSGSEIVNSVIGALEAIDIAEVIRFQGKTSLLAGEKDSKSQRKEKRIRRNWVSQW
jgi:hypothetical protein